MTTLTELQHTEDREGPWKLYIYDHNIPFHQGGIWFRKGPLRYPDEEITLAEAKRRCESAIAAGRQVRICDGGDMLVLHWDGKFLYGEHFWKEVAP